MEMKIGDKTYKIKKEPTGADQEKFFEILAKIKPDDSSALPELLRFETDLIAKCVEGFNSAEEVNTKIGITEKKAIANKLKKMIGYGDEAEKDSKK